MPEDVKPQDGDKQEKPQPQTPAPEPKASDAGDSGLEKQEAFSREYVQELRAENAQRRKEARELQKRLEELESTRKQVEEKELVENQKWQQLAEKREKELAELKAALETERINNMRVRIGSEFKLPAKLQARLQGNTEDEIRADAKSLAEELGLDKPPAETPKADAKPTTAPELPARSQTTAIAPDGQPLGETDEQRRARLYKRGATNSPLFQPRK